MKVHARKFSPWIHAEDGVTVVFSDGEELTLKSLGTGWGLVNKDGASVIPMTPDASELTRLILKYEGA